ncbi:MAG: endopeptidase La [Acidiferrobacterales bacterium]|nr:endopeptidase La [Acidiferrobacterales bacterium]
MTQDSDNLTPEPLTLPLVPLRDVVVFPQFIVPLFVGRDHSKAALDRMDKQSPLVMLVTQRDPATDDPTGEDLYDIGVVATVKQVVVMPDSSKKVVVEGLWRARIDAIRTVDGYQEVRTSPLEIIPIRELLIDSLRESLQDLFEQYIKTSQKIPAEVLAKVKHLESLNQVIDIIAAHLINQSVVEKQAILEEVDDQERLELMVAMMSSDVELFQVERKIRGRIKKQMEKSQREYYLNEQLKAIHKELGNGDEAKSEVDELSEKIAEAGMTKEAQNKAVSELKKLNMMSPMSAEATVVRNYIDWLIAVPWRKRSRIHKDLNAAQRVLDEDHYGLEKVKERILEYLAVQQRVRKNKAPILCLVGPPGVGKTSLGKSVARATNRKFLRMSLGGVRDEAEIRGHRRTYIGSLPGKIIQSIAKVKTRNPLFMLDEVDKMSMDFRGDPSSALLEVLDPEQNHTFADHYLEVEYDLSEVMFIATANTLNIPPPLLDRMEVIRISGYTEDEKVRIATQYLIPKQLKSNGLEPKNISISEKVLLDVIRYYTRESGVRGLEREISKICRKVTKKLVQDNSKSRLTRITPRNLHKFCGVRQYRFGMADQVNQIGQVTGLAWTQTGGDLLSIEAIVVPGKGKHIYTGKLGDVMQESIQAAVSVVRARSINYGIKSNFYQRKDIHVHVPEGATPKDGPSAGVAMSVAIISALTQIPIRADVAMTGEITLRGEVLPIGGLKEKLLAAHRGGISTVLIPEQNEKDLAEISNKIKDELDIVCVRWIEDVVSHSLEYLPDVTIDSSDMGLGLESDQHSGENVSVVKH